MDFKQETGQHEKKVQFVSFRAKGFSYAKIAKKLGVAKSTLANWNAELEEEITTLRAMELESLMEQFYLAKEGRIKLLGNILRDLVSELQKRQLNKLSTDKLLDLFLKYFTELKTEFIELRPLSQTERRNLKNQKDKIGTKLNKTNQVSGELKNILLRLRSGIISNEQASRELAILLALLKANDQEEIVEKVNRIQTILEARK